MNNYFWIGIGSSIAGVFIFGLGVGMDNHELVNLVPILLLFSLINLNTSRMELKEEGDSE